MYNYNFIIIISIIIFVIISIIIKNDTSSEDLINNIIKNNTNIKIYNSNTNNSNTNNKDIIMIFNNKKAYDKIVNKGELGLAESYMDGDWYSNDLEKLLIELVKHEDILATKIKYKALSLITLQIKSKINSYLPNNTLISSKQNITKHYDIGNNLYIKMLGKYMQYTCAYFNKPNMTLDEAQLAKMLLIAKKLNLKEGMNILDIGCGFGSLGYFLVTNYNIKVTGVTLSKEQKIYADKYYKHPNLVILLKDYRDVNEVYDRVYSVGILEHIGRKNYKEYYDKCYSLLIPNGIMLIHTICGISREPTNYKDFIRTYIFPEGEMPMLSSFTDIYSDKWHLEDLQNIGMSYAKTLKCWKDNLGDWNGLSEYDNKFRKMWDYYLVGSIANFKLRKIFLCQLVYTKQNNTMEDNCNYIRN